MWWRESIHSRDSKKNRPKYPFLVDPKFQWKHTGALVLAMNIPVIIVFAVSYYFIEQNYMAFLEMAYRYSPELIVHLKREYGFLRYLFAVSALGLTAYTVFLGLSMTFRLIGPVSGLKRHLNNLIRGDWSQPPLRVRGTDDYHDLVDVYNYFYSSLRRQSEWELEQISKCQLSPYALESLERKKALIAYKSGQLSLNPEDYEIEEKAKENDHISIA